MFYHIGSYTPYLKKVHDNLYLDDGWNCINNIWYKGYSTECKLSESLTEIISGYQPKGIWCVITQDITYKVYYSKLRGFQEYKTENYLTNLFIENSKYLPNNFEVKIKEETNLETVVENITTILLDNCKNFVKYNNDLVNIWCTGGIDSTSIIALFEKAEIPYNVYIAKPKNQFNGRSRDWEKSLNEYSNELLEYTKKHYWGYEILSHFCQSIILATGFYGDEYCGRGPYQINYIANSLGKIALDVIKPDQYMYNYLLRTHKKEPYNLENISEIDAKQSIINNIFGDYQIWHLDNIITFCPYYDIDILIETLRLKNTELIEYCVNGTIQKEIIKKCCPDVLKLVDNHKNTLEGRKNFEKNINDVQLDYCKEIIWV